MRQLIVPVRPLALLVCAAMLLASCSDPDYDVSTPQAALDAAHRMAREGRADLMASLLHIEAREITYDDGVTEASAISDVLSKAGDMLGQLYRVADKLRARFPDQIARALAAAAPASGRSADRLFGSDGLDRFLVDPFGLLHDQRQRLSAEDLGDGTAAVLLDGKPMFAGLGLMMREIDGRWKFEVPIALLRDFRPNTRHEWAVIASMMLGLEHSLREFEQELDAGKVRSLAHAGERAGRLLFESAAIQMWLYQQMKKHGADEPRS